MPACNVSDPVPYQPITPPLKARKGEMQVTIDWLVNNHKDRDHITVEWLDNEHLIYSSPRINKDENQKIEILNIRNNSYSFLAEGSLALPSPNGQWIAFVRQTKDTSHLFIIGIDGAEEKLIAELSGEYEYNYSYVWAPDSNRLALVHYYHNPEQRLKEKPIHDQFKSSAIVVGENTQFIPPRSVITIFDLIKNESQEVFSTDVAIHDISWLANGLELIFIAAKWGRYYNNEKDYTWVQSLNIQTKELHNLLIIDGIQCFLSPISSPDGNQIAFMYDADFPEFNLITSVCLISTYQAKSGSQVPIMRLTFEMVFRRPQWSHDAQKIYALRNYGAYRQIYSIDAKTGTLKQITDSPLRIDRFALSPDGTQLAWIGQDAHAKTILRIAKSDGHNVRDLCVFASVPDNFALSEVQEIDWQVPNYPSRMKGLLLLPLNYQKGIRYPLLIDIHGGGPGASIYLWGGILVSTPLEWQIWTAKDYAVFVPDFRSSCHYGSLAITRNERQEFNLIDYDIKDIVAGVDHLIEQGIADPNRTVILGHSAGARRANWLTVSTNRFNAVVSKEGWADEWLRTGIHPYVLSYKIFNGPPVLVPENYQKNSPIFHARGASTPTLFLMGNPQLGGADQYNTVRWLYNALKAQGVETQYVQYPDEGHNLERPANRRDALERITLWIDKHMRKD